MEVESSNPIPSSRAEALLVGAKFYFTGKSCKRGGVAQRKTVDCQCECEGCRAASNEKYKKYHAKNRIVRNAQSRQYIADNRDAVLAYKKEYRAEKAARISNYMKRWRSGNADRLKLYDYHAHRRYYSANKDAVLSRCRLYYAANREKIRLSSKSYYEDNKAAFYARNSVRRKATLDRTSAWFGELDRFVLEEAFDLAFLREQALGICWHVDHMTPLQGSKVSGLHCWNNIQVIPAAMNRAKHNKNMLTEPGQWINAL